VSAAHGNGGLKVLTGRVVPCAERDSGDQRAVAIRDGKVVAVGDASLVEKSREEGAEILDYGERPILPGFVDPHVHLEEGSRANAEMVDCRAPGCRNIEDVLQRLHESLPRAAESGWMVGQGNLFFDQKLEEKRFPTKDELDSVSTDVAIAIRAGSHRTVLNSKAFEVSGVADYEGKAGVTGKAIVEVDQCGCPTGEISELDGVLPIPVPDEDELRETFRTGVHDLFTSYGVTTIGEITNTREGLRCIDHLIDAGEAPLRVSLFLWAPGTVSVDEACRWEEHFQFHSDRDRLDVRGLKLFADGGYSARNAATRKPFKPPYALRPGSRGSINLNRRQILSALKKANAAGLQLAVHANGERAQDVACLAVENAGGPDESLRTRMEHGGNFISSSETTDNWRRAGVIPIGQPVFLYNFFGDFLPLYLGEHGEHGRLPLKTLLQDGWKVASSSDLHVGAEDRATNPMFSVWCCVERQSFYGQTIEPEQRISVSEALKLHTIYPAISLGEGDNRGSLEPGKHADVIVLEEDPREVPTDKLLDVKVDHVFLAGEPVHSRQGAAAAA
jgi:predicted amidohydrolase YtcJ